jgi:hypothetical protein
LAWQKTRHQLKAPSKRSRGLSLHAAPRPLCALSKLYDQRRVMVHQKDDIANSTDSQFCGIRNYVLLLKEDE